MLFRLFNRSRWRLILQISLFALCVWLMSQFQLQCSITTRWLPVNTSEVSHSEAFVIPESVSEVETLPPVNEVSTQAAVVISSEQSTIGEPTSRAPSEDFCSCCFYATADNNLLSVIDQDTKEYYHRAILTMRPPRPEKLVWSKQFPEQRLAAAIVEPREHDSLLPVLYNMAHVYGGSNVSLYIFHGLGNEVWVKQLLTDWTNVYFINLNVTEVPIATYNQLLTNASFYLTFGGAQFVLVFQTDSLIRRQIDEDFFQYDWVGAPWSDGAVQLGPQYAVHQPPGGNGGFSLRRISAMLDIIAENPYVNVPENVHEDIFLSYKVTNQCPFEERKRFSVETLYGNNPVGTHKPWYYYKNQMLLSLMHGVPGLCNDGDVG